MTKAPKKGLMLAPGASNDHSMNQYIKETLNKYNCLSRIYSKKNDLFEFQHPSFSGISIEASIKKLIINRNCDVIFVLGEQCKNTIINYLSRPSLSLDMNINIYMINDVDVTSSDKFIKNVKEIPGNKGHKYTIYSHNYYEQKLSAGLGIGVAILAKRYNEKYGIDTARVAIIGGANVPITSKWITGFKEGYCRRAANETFVAYTLGTGYSKFDDPHSGYELTRYLIETYRVNFVVQVCGASCTGVIKAICEHRDNHRENNKVPIFYIPYDYHNWNGYALPESMIPLCLVRRIDYVIDQTIKGNVNKNTKDLVTGHLYQRETELGFLTDSEKNDIYAITRKLAIMRA